ncbi:MAG TPA: nuclear transport factor 2 family protein [Steroidobacteraceae bacterium]|jgi:ketosteroid isomerase-like protein
MNEAEGQIRAVIDAETAAWDACDANALVRLFHPDTVWPWPPHSAAHDPIQWVMPLGRYDRERWANSWQELFDSHELLHNRRQTLRVVVSGQGDGGFAVVDVDTLWRHRTTGNLFHWKGRACKVYTKVSGRWLFLFQTGLLEYQEPSSQVELPVV